MDIGQALDLVSRYDSLRNPLTSLGDYLDPELISRCLAEAGIVMVNMRHRAGYNIRVQRVGTNRRLNGFVMFREWPVVHFVDGEQTRYAFRVHDKRTNVAARCGLAVVGYVHTGPFFSIPMQQGSFGIPRFS